MNTLDARQRAMLLDMGVRVWPPPAHGLSSAPPASTAPAPLQAQPKPVPPVQALAEASAPKGPQDQDGTAPALHWQVQEPRLLHPQADPARAPAGLGAGWLIVAESFGAGDAVAHAAERLLENMLRALQLHRHPRVALCAVARGDSGSGAGEIDATAAIARHVEAFAPSVVLVMGRGAVRAALARSEPLGKLRGAALAIGGVPAVVTFGPHFLLRSPESKSAAWADLCRARALAGQRAAMPMP